MIVKVWKDKLNKFEDVEIDDNPFMLIGYVVIMTTKNNIYLCLTEERETVFEMLCNLRNQIIGA